MQIASVTLTVGAITADILLDVIDFSFKNVPNALGGYAAAFAVIGDVGNILDDCIGTGLAEELILTYALMSTTAAWFSALPAVSGPIGLAASIILSVILNLVVKFAMQALKGLAGCEET